MHSCWVSVSSCSPYLSSLSSNNIIICFVELGIRFFVDRLLFVFLFSSCSQLLDFWLLAMYSSRFSLLFLEGYGFNSIKHHWIFPPPGVTVFKQTTLYFFRLSPSFTYFSFLLVGLRWSLRILVYSFGFASLCGGNLKFIFWDQSRKRSQKMNVCALCILICTREVVEPVECSSCWATVWEFCQNHVVEPVECLFILFEKRSGNSVMILNLEMVRSKRGCSFDFWIGWNFTPPPHKRGDGAAQWNEVGGEKSQLRAYWGTKSCDMSLELKRLLFIYLFIWSFGVVYSGINL